MKTAASDDHTGWGWGLLGALAVCIIVATLLVYGQTRHFEFLGYDDPIYTTDNLVVQQGLTLSGIVWAFTEGTYHTNYWAPLTWITFLIDSELHGLHPGGCHLTNVVWHMMNALLVWGAFSSLTGRLWRSFWLALFFALHPLHVESVAWIAERKDVVSTFFWMLTLIAYARYVREPGAGSYLLVFLMFLACLMGKPMGITLPFVLLLLDFWPLGRYRLAASPEDREGGASFWKLVREKIPLFALIAVIAPLTYFAQGRAGALKPLADISLLFRIENVLVSYAGQVLKTFWPLHLGLLYPYPESLPPGLSLGAFLFLAAVCAGVWHWRRRFPYLIVGWLWFLGTFVPVAGFLVIGPHVTADRYTYIPLVGFLLMLIWGAADLAARWHWPRRMVAVLGIFLAILSGLLAWKQASYWRNDITIYEHTLSVTRHNWPVHLNLGAAYFAGQQFKPALSHYERAFHLRPDIPEIQLGVGVVLTALGRNKAAVAHYKTVLHHNPGSAVVHSALAGALLRDGIGDRAIYHYRAALAINEDFAEAHQGLGVALVQCGQVAQAIAHYQQAIRIDNGYALAYYNLGVALIMQEDEQMARACFKKAIAAGPKYADPHYALGALDLKKNDRARARAGFKRALELEPQHAGARKGLAMLP